VTFMNKEITEPQKPLSLLLRVDLAFPAVGTSSLQRTLAVPAVHGDPALIQRWSRRGYGLPV